MRKAIAAVSSSLAVRPRPLLVKVVAILVAGSGLLNLRSLLSGAPPAPWTQDLFPLDFAGLARSATLLAGFILILTALNLWSGKQRAWWLSFPLALLSIVLHLTRSWNPAEATVSAAIACALWFTRREFRLGSARPSLSGAISRAALGLTLVALYGAAGFWLLEPNELHRNFHWYQAAEQALRFLFFSGDKTLVPHTPYAAWFLDSLFWVSALGFLYCGLTLFRPVRYRFTLDSEGRERAAGIAAVHGTSAQDYFKHAADKSYYFSPSGRTFLAYRVARNFALVLGDPVGPPEDFTQTVDGFVRYCHQRGWRVGFHQVSDSHVAEYEAFGFHRLRVGDEAIVDLQKFSLTGSAMKEFRNTVNRLERAGYRVERIDPPVANPLLEDLKTISDNWLSIPGHRERRFTLGQFDRAYVQSTPLYVAFDGDNHAVAFLNLVPSYRHGLATVDLMRRSPNAASGVMDFLFARAFLDLKADGFEKFSLGLAPLSEPSKNDPNMDEQVVCWTMNRLRFLFRSDSLRRFKSKYANEWWPRYAIYEGRFDLPRLALALREVTEQPRSVRGTA